MVGLITTAIAVHKSWKNSGSQALETPACRNEPFWVPKSDAWEIGLVVGAAV